MTELEKALRESGDASPRVPFEERVRRVDAIVRSLESDDTPLEEALERFEEARGLLAGLYSELGAMEQRIEALTREGELVAFEPRPDAAAEASARGPVRRRPGPGSDEASP